MPPSAPPPGVHAVPGGVSEAFHAFGRELDRGKGGEINVCDEVEPHIVSSAANPGDAMTDLARSIYGVHTTWVMSEDLGTG